MTTEEHEGIKQWLKAVDDRRKQQRDRRLEEATYFANKIRHSIELAERECLNAASEMSRLASEGDLNWLAMQQYTDLLAAEIRGMRRALRILTG